MDNKNLVSLRRFRAKQLYDVYYALPSSQRTRARATKLTEAIIDYAYENVPRHRGRRSGRLCVNPGESRLISRRLEEFILPGAESDPDSLMNWLHANMITEAWTYPDDLRGFVQDCLCDA